MNQTSYLCVTKSKPTMEHKWTVKMTANVASEIRYKLGVVGETDDLLEDYGVTEDEVDELIKSIPDEGLWIIPQQHSRMVIEEIDDHIDILDSQMHEADVDGDFESAQKTQELINEFMSAIKQRQFTHPFHKSTERDRNRKRFKEGSGNFCICCYRPMKEGETKMLHMNEDWYIVSNEVTQENCKELTGANSQGMFNIGNSCAKRIPKEFVMDLHNSK
jgi:hypothetical protein